MVRLRLTRSVMSKQLTPSASPCGGTWKWGTLVILPITTNCGKPSGSLEKYTPTKLGRAYVATAYKMAYCAAVFQLLQRTSSVW